MSKQTKISDLEKRIESLERQVSVFCENAKYYDHRDAAKVETLKSVIGNMTQIMVDKLEESGR
jgi:hypothetical protein